MTHPAMQIAEREKRKAADFMTWTPEQKNIIAKVSYETYRDQPDRTRQSAVNAGVQAVPEAGHRFLPYANIKKWLMPMWEAMDKEQGLDLVNSQRRVARIEHPEQAQPTAMQLAFEKSTQEVPVPTPENIPSPPPVSAKQPKKTNVYWRPDEIETVALEAATIMANDHEGEYSDLEVARLAQKVLPEDRHRKLDTTSQASRVIDRATQLIPVVRKNMVRKVEEARIQRENEERSRKMEEERIERERIAAEAKEQAAHEIEETRRKYEEEQTRTRAQAEAFSAAVAAEVSKQLDQATYPALLSAIAKKVMGDFMGSLAEQIQATVVEQVRTAAAEQVKLAIAAMPVKEVPASVVQVAQGSTFPADASELKMAPKDHIAKIVVVGLTYQQFDDLKKGFFGLAELELVKTHAAGSNGGNAGAAMLSAANRADVVIAMTDHCGPDVKAAGLKCPVPFIRITGAMSGARRWIRQWLNGEISLAA